MYHVWLAIFQKFNACKHLTSIFRTFPIKFPPAWISSYRSSLLTLPSGHNTSDKVPRCKYFNASTAHFSSLSFTLPTKALRKSIELVTKLTTCVQNKVVYRILVQWNLPTATTDGPTQSGLDREVAFGDSCQPMATMNQCGCIRKFAATSEWDIPHLYFTQHGTGLVPCRAGCPRLHCNNDMRAKVCSWLKSRCASRYVWSSNWSVEFN